ncbi:HTH_Tnp_Tc3_2 domain-containing protein [Trichonephila clavipes]|nr:HTH_Tnp_Tc3_2 domain-containing protein [Trichonephila clavipes]
MHFKSVGARNPPEGVVWNLGEMDASSSVILDRNSKLRGPSGCLFPDGKPLSDKLGSFGYPFPKSLVLFYMRGERRLRCIVGSQRSQTLAHIATQFNDGASRTVSKRTVQRSFHSMGFGSDRPTRVPLFNARYRAVPLVWAREHRD